MSEKLDEICEKQGNTKLARKAKKMLPDYDMMPDLY